jgi:hypothetical protein
MPQEYLAGNDEPVRMLVAGWGPQHFMIDIIREVDSGSNRLPSGSHLVFMNCHEPRDSLEPALRACRLRNLKVRMSV